MVESLMFAHWPNSFTLAKKNEISFSAKWVHSTLKKAAPMQKFLLFFLFLLTSYIDDENKIFLITLLLIIKKLSLHECSVCSPHPSLEYSFVPTNTCTS